MIKNQKLDFVIIALPPYLHYEINKKALLNKIHVLKEKPFAISLTQAKELKNLSDKNKIQIAVTLQRRFNTIYSTFFQLKWVNLYIAGIKKVVNNFHDLL